MTIHSVFWSPMIRVSTVGELTAIRSLLSHPWRFMDPPNSFAPILTKLSPRADFLTDRTWCDCHCADFHEIFFFCRQLSGAFATLRKTTVIFVMSVRPSEWNNSAPTGRIFMILAPTGRIFTIFDIRVFFEHLLSKLKFYENVKTSIHFLIISRSVRLGPRKL